LQNCSWGINSGDSNRGCRHHAYRVPDVDPFTEQLPPLIFSKIAVLFTVNVNEIAARLASHGVSKIRVEHFSTTNFATAVVSRLN
jgi:hypothetical protein